MHMFVGACNGSVKSSLDEDCEQCNKLAIHMFTNPEVKKKKQTHETHKQNQE